MLDRRRNFDEKSREFPIRALLPVAATGEPALRSYTWSCGVWLNQCPADPDKRCGGGCAGMATAAEAAASPVVVPGVTEDLAWRIYDLAQRYDEWAETPPEEGTSVLAALKAARELGLIDEFRWAFGLRDLVTAIGLKGPAILGVDWFDGMMEPDADGWLHVEGAYGGGHAILARQVRFVFLAPRVPKVWANVDHEKSYVGLHQSWGNSKLQKISFSELDFLLERRGEAAIPIRRRRPIAA